MKTYTTIKNLKYADRGGVELRLDLHLPDGVNGLLPVVLGVPGGGWRSCVKEDVPRFLVDHGFAMACINYRVSGNAIAPANIQDCKAAVSWVRVNARQYGLDAERMGAYGASAGGHLAALLGISAGVRELEGSGGVLLSPSAAVQAVCAVCGPMDLTRIGIPEIRERFALLYEVTEQHLGGPALERTELARLVSPLSYVSRHVPPMLLIHGTADPIVPVEETLLFHQALQAAGAKSTLITMEGGGHAWFHEETGDKIARFFKDTLL